MTSAARAVVAFATADATLATAAVTRVPPVDALFTASCTCPRLKFSTFSTCHSYCVLVRPLL